MYWMQADPLKMNPAEQEMDTHLEPSHSWPAEQLVEFVLVQLLFTGGVPEGQRHCPLV